MNKMIFTIILSNLVVATPITLHVKQKAIQVNEKLTTVLTIEQDNGTWGYYGKAGNNFDVIVKNDLNESTVIHWHGLQLPNQDDGTSLTQTYIPPHGTYKYNFKLKDVGTFWMHSHAGLQLASLAEAPLIIESTNDNNYKQVVVLFQAFNFKSPDKILADIKSNAKHMAMMAMRMGNGDMNDADYDAYLTNYHTPQDPEVVSVLPGENVKLRFINGSMSSNFWVKLGNLTESAYVVAIDGRDIMPYKAKEYQLSEGQRMDIIVHIPKSGGSFPILGQVEGLNNQTGLILTTNKKLINSIPFMTDNVAKRFNDNQELHLSAIRKMPNKPITQVIKYTLNGDMLKYVWSINNQIWPNITPVNIKLGSRVELVFYNNTVMAHPMHLHGFAFKIVEINNKKIDGALRDTVEVLPYETVKAIFDADSLGKWLLHCHIGWHMPTGMMTYINVIK